MSALRCGARFTRSFKDQVARLACQCSKRAVSLMRIAWLSVGRILSRVVTEVRERFDPLDHLVRVGIDEISHRKGDRYLAVVVDHDSGLLVWGFDQSRAKRGGPIRRRLAADRSLRPRRIMLAVRLEPEVGRGRRSASYRER